MKKQLNEIESSIEKGIESLKQLIIENEKRLKINKKIKEDRYLYRSCSYKDFHVDNILYYQVMRLIGDPVYFKFIESSEDENFWSNSTILTPCEGCEHQAYFLLECGLAENKNFKNFLNDLYDHQTNSGCFWNYPDDHIAILPLLAVVDPNNKNTINAINYVSNKNIDKLDLIYKSLLLLTLTDLNNDKYNELLTKCIKSITNTILLSKKFKKILSFHTIEILYFIIKSFLRIDGKSSPVVKSSISYILTNQRPNGSWGEKSGDLYSTCYALLALLYFLPPKMISYEEFLFNERKWEFKKHSIKPYFIHTSPFFQNKLHITDILKIVKKCFDEANQSIRIMTPYYDMMYEEIINMISSKPKLIVKIITRPKKDIKGPREKIGKNVQDLLEVATKGNFKKSDLVHSRMIIVDEKQLIISSADLTREGLYDEYNAGIYTCDMDTLCANIVVA